MKDYLPVIAALISLITAVIVVLIGSFNSKKTEIRKAQDVYYNFKLKQIYDEYCKYDPVIDFSHPDAGGHLRIIEKKFKECRISINKISPLIDESILKPLSEIEEIYNRIIREQENARIVRKQIDPINATAYSEMLCRYIDLGQSIIMSKIRYIRMRFESS